MVENPTSFEDFYQNYHQAMVSRVLHQVHHRINWAEAEEIVQEMWIAAEASWDRCDDHKKRASWIMGITYHKALHYMRNRERKGRPVTHNVEDLENIAAEETTPEDIWTGVQAVMEREGRMKELDEFNPDYYEVIYLQRVYGLTLGEISERLGISPGTVRSRLNRGLAFLGVDTRYGKCGTKPQSSAPVITPPSVKHNHPWYAKSGEAPGPTYRTPRTITRPNHYELGGATAKPNCPGYRKCPVCSHFPIKDTAQ